MKVIEYLCTKHILINIICATLSLLCIIVNAILNPYARDNKRLKKATACILRLGRLPKDIVLPYYYKVSFELFCSNRDVSPSRIFRFCPIVRIYRFLTLPCAMVSLSLLISVYGTFIQHSSDLLGGSIAVALFMVFCLLAVREVGTVQRKRANKVYLQFVGSLENCYLCDNTRDASINNDEVSKTAQSLTSKSLDIRELSALFPPEKLYRERTVEAQRQLNDALNRLFTNMAKRV